MASPCWVCSVFRENERAATCFGLRLGKIEDSEGV
jgi:hypothetical protein